MEVNCSICSEHFIGTTGFLNHFFTSHSLPPVSHSDENITKGSAHEEISSCGICGMKITGRTNTMKHINSHIGIMPYYCNLCYFPTISEYALLQHKLSHHQESPKCFEILELHTCEVCYSAFKTLFELTMHYMNHLMEMPFSCGDCKMLFPEKNDLIVHSQLHGKSPHCFLCAETFKDRVELLTHVLTHRKSRFFQKFEMQLESKQLFTIFPQQSSAFLNKKKITIKSVKSLDSFEKKAENATGTRTSLKLRTSDIMNSQSIPQLQNSGIIEKWSILQQQTSDVTERHDIPESRASDAINSQSIPESRTFDAIETRCIPEERTTNVIESKSIPESRVSDVIKSQSIPESRTLEAIETRCIPEERTTNVIESKSIPESRASDAFKRQHIPNLKALNASEFQIIPELRISDVLNSNLEPRISEIFKSKTNIKPINAVVIDNANIECRSHLKLNTFNVVKNRNDHISNSNFTLSDFSTELEIEEIKMAIKKEPDVEYQEDIDYLCDVVMEDKKFDLEHFISNFSTDSRSNNQSSKKSRLQNSVSSNAYFCNRVATEQDPEITSKKDYDTLSNGYQVKNNPIFQKEKPNMVSSLALAVELPEFQSNIFESSTIFYNKLESKSKKSLELISCPIKEPEVQQKLLGSQSLRTDPVSATRNKRKTFRNKKSKVKSSFFQPKSKPKESLELIYSPIKEPEVQHKLLGSNSLKIDPVSAKRSKRKTFKNQKSKAQSSSDLSLITVDKSSKKSRCTTTIQAIHNSDIGISNKSIKKLQPQLDGDICSAISTCLPSKKSNLKSRPQFNRKDLCKVTREPIKSPKLRSKSNRINTCKPSPVCIESQKIQEKLKSQLRNDLDKSVLNALKPDKRSLRSGTRLLTDQSGTAKNLSELHQIRTRSQSKSTQLQNLGLKKLSVLLHRLPSYVLGMRSYRKYCRMQKLDMLRGQGRSKQKVTESSVQKEQVSTTICLGKKKCFSMNLQSNSIKGKHLEVDKCNDSPNSKLSTSKYWYETDTNKVVNTSNANSACKIASLKGKHRYSAKIPKTFSSKICVSAPFKTTAKKKVKFSGKSWRKSRRKSAKSGKIKTCLLPHLQENSQKEESIHSDGDHFNGNGSSIYTESGGPSSLLSNVGHFCEIYTDGNDSVTRSIGVNPTCKTVLAKQHLSIFENKSESCYRKKNIFSKSFYKTKDNVTSMKSINNKQASSANHSIRSSPRLSSPSSKSSFRDKRHLPNIHTRDDFNIKLKSDLRNCKEITQTGNHEDHIRRSRLPSNHVNINRIGECSKYITRAIKRISHEHTSTKHQVNEGCIPSTLTNFDAFVHLERLDEDMCNMSSYNAFCNNDKTDKRKMSKMEDSGLEHQGGLNESASGYCKPKTKSINHIKGKCVSSRNRSKGKTNLNKNPACSFQAVKRMNNSVVNSMQKGFKQNSKERVNDFINENAVEEFCDSEDTDTASSHGDFLSSDDSSQDSSNQYSLSRKIMKSRRELFPMFTNSLERCDHNVSECSENCSYFHLGREKNSKIPHSSENQQRSFNRTGNTETTIFEKSALIPFKYSSMKNQNIANTNSSTIFKPKIIECRTIKNALSHDNKKAPVLDSLKKQEPTKKRVRKTVHKLRKARIIPNCRVIIPNHQDNSGIKKSKKSTMSCDKPKIIKNVFYGLNKKIFWLQHPSHKNNHFRKEIEKSIFRKKVNGPQKCTLPKKRPSRHKPENNPHCVSRSIDLTVKLQQLPASIYEKFLKDKPIMLSSLPPIVENVTCIHCKLKRIHQITIEHSYCVSGIKSIPLVRYEHSYSSWSAIM